jgi:hypothetical protein
MGRKLVVYSAGLIALYLVVLNASGSGQVLLEGSKGGSRLIQAFQGRSVPGL